MSRGRLPTAPPRGRGDGGVPSEGLQRRLLVGLNGDELVQSGDLEHLPDAVVDVTQHQLAADALDLLVQGDELAEGGARQVFDVAVDEQELLAVALAFLIDQAVELVADDLDVLLVQDLAINEIDHGDVAHWLSFRTTPARLR